MTYTLAAFVRQRCKLLQLSQPDLAAKAGVGLRFVRELEQGKATLRLFGHELPPAPSTAPNYSPGSHEKSRRTPARAVGLGVAAGPEANALMRSHPRNRPMGR